MISYLAVVEGSAHDVTADGQPRWRFLVTRAVRAESETQARAIAVGRVAREWAAGAGRSYGGQPRLTVTELRSASRFGAWWRGRGGYVFPKSPA